MNSAPIQALPVSWTSTAFQCEIIHRAEPGRRPEWSMGLPEPVLVRVREVAVDSWRLEICCAQTSVCAVNAGP